MTDGSGATMSGALVLEERDGSGSGAGAGLEQASPPEAGRPRCGGCALWTRQQTWLCVVPLLIGLVGLALSLMLLQWIVVGSVPDYVPTDLVDAKGIGQDPIFLSKPSAFPKGPATTTGGAAATPAPVGPASTAIAATATARPRPGARPGPAAGSQAPHLHNRVGTRVTAAIPPPGTTTTRAPRVVTPRSTVRRPGGRNGVFSSTSRAALPSSAPSPSSHPVLHNSGQTQNHERPKGPPATPARPHTHTKTLVPTSPPLRSEHFKPCRDKDLAYCLNEGECFIIETLTGSHKHCRCKEGYQGVRCDQFLPKTDSILSDPTDNLGIEFMESKEMYKRQVLSISCITAGISLLGTFCIALYCRNKRRSEKLQAHLKECRSLKCYSSSGLLPKSSLRPQCGLHLQSYGKGNGSSTPHGVAIRKVGILQSCAVPAARPRASPPGKHHSPSQRARLTRPHRTPPTPRGRLNPIGVCRDSGPIYQHLQEAQSSDREAEPLQECPILKADGGGAQDTSLNMQAPASAVGGHTEGPAPSSSFRTCSIPIIPSVQGHCGVSCEPMANLDAGGRCSLPQGQVGGHPRRLSTVHPAVTSGGQQGSPFALEAKQRLRALPHNYRKADDCGAKKMDRFPSATGTETSALAQNGPTLVHPREPITDSVWVSQ
ncbi:pro-neuregulin-3, membrane-bound isoform [Brienomyrus brachyistius]|uniref:pro-neuregulin-3, membrane-bound isoform n=1 Tax=Brienomyrus brachyistius TaxID=42636 RepID=UPI0020B3C7F1|nr:pro-neuregulin-3, membrane-bound isoform [Brienomyrus brachyistius]